MKKKKIKKKVKTKNLEMFPCSEVIMLFLIG